MGLRINDECDSWHVLHCKQNLIIFQKPTKKNSNICAFRILFTMGNGNQYLLVTTKERFTRVSQNGISMNLAKKTHTHTHIFITPTTN
jgi:hypothetical protein